MAGVRISWAKGGEATVAKLVDDAIALRSSIPSPPGSRIEGAVGGAGGDVVRVKVHSSKRQDDGSFVLEGRVLDMTRALRDKLGEGV
jgi:hypothetical protein